MHWSGLDCLDCIGGTTKTQRPGLKSTASPPVRGLKESSGEEDHGRAHQPAAANNMPTDCGFLAHAPRKDRLQPPRCILRTGGEALSRAWLLASPVERPPKGLKSKAATSLPICTLSSPSSLPHSARRTLAAPGRSSTPDALGDPGFENEA